MSTIRLYRQQGKKRECIAGYGEITPQRAVDFLLRFALEYSRITGLSLATIRHNGCTEFRIGDTRFFYWIIGKGQDSRGYLKDRKP